MSVVRPEPSSWALAIVSGKKVLVQNMKSLLNGKGNNYALELGVLLLVLLLL